MEDRRERSSMLWRDYFLRQRQQRAGRDRLASAVVILILTVMAVRMQGKVNRGDMLHYAANVFLALISAFNSRSHTYMLWRNLLAVVLRLSVVTCDLVSKHAENMLQEDAPGLPTALVTSAVRILVGDHALLLAFLATGWPVGSLSNILLQFISLLLITNHNRDICNTPFMRQTTSMSGIEALRPAASLEPRSAWDAIAPALFARHNKVEVSPPAWPGVDHALLQHVRPPQVCMVYTTILQTIIGFVLPAFFFLCYDSRSAVKFAEEHSIPREDGMHRFYWRLHASFCVHGTAFFRLSLLVLFIAILWVLGCFAMAPT